jgi:hypothetical protein
MNDALQGYDGGGSNQGRNERDPAESQMRLRQALRTLRGIRQRYKFDHAGRPDSYPPSVQVALGHTDMCWITAAIEAVEKQSQPVQPKLPDPKSKLVPET